MKEIPVKPGVFYEDDILVLFMSKWPFYAKYEVYEDDEVW